MINMQMTKMPITNMPITNMPMDKIYIEEWYKKNKCLDKARLFALCMKQTPNSPVENKCKNIFDEWYECILLDPHVKVQYKSKVTYHISNINSQI